MLLDSQPDSCSQNLSSLFISNHVINCSLFLRVFKLQRDWDLCVCAFMCSYPYQAERNINLSWVSEFEPEGVEDISKFQMISSEEAHFNTHIATFSVSPLLLKQQLKNSFCVREICDKGSRDRNSCFFTCFNLSRNRLFTLEWKFHIT